MSEAYVRVEDLKVSFPTEDGLVRAVDGVSFTVDRGQTLAIVGESGSGKSVTSQALMGLVNKRNARVEGRAYVGDNELIDASDDELRKLRGSVMSMIFQDPFASLHPFYRIGVQLVEAVRVHRNVSKAEARAQAVDMLRRVGIPNPDQRIDDYPHQLSGGMRQRVMIAMALINGPSLLIADEPTTALDVTVQAQIMELLAELQEQYNTAIILITHDLGVVADVADEVAVMYGGRLVERGSLQDIFHKPQMPYTVGLLSSVPRLDSVSERLTPIPGQPPSLINLPPGCVFAPRCRAKGQFGIEQRCGDERPDLLTISPTHAVRCFLEPDQRRQFADESLAAAAGVPGGAA
ncbi:MAG: ATP-binding cassette domain-containing protein [Actinomycetales bacterium]|nr:ATP-binding cassette domain-containing protein [Actinomycetales bacterium]